MIGNERLVVGDLCRGDRVRGVSFAIRRGEVLGLTGLVGAGRTETARLIFGADRRDGGTISLDGRLLDIRHPRDAIAAGIGLLTEDRKSQGLVLTQSVRENFGLPNLSRFTRWGWISHRREGRAFEGYRESLNIKAPHAEQLARNLSGGNQQKVVLAKWLERHCEVIDHFLDAGKLSGVLRLALLLLLLLLLGEGFALLARLQFGKMFFHAVTPIRRWLESGRQTLCGRDAACRAPHRGFARSTRRFPRN